MVVRTPDKHKNACKPAQLVGTGRKDATNSRDGIAVRGYNGSVVLKSLLVSVLGMHEEGMIWW